MIIFGNKNDEICAAPFLIRTIEEPDNIIKFFVAMPVKKEKGEIIDIENPELNKILCECVPLQPEENDIYEIIFENYIFHTTRNESYTCKDDYEISQGKYFVVFDKSRLLDCLPQIVEQSIIEACFPNGWKHYGIYCQNHIIDVIAVEEPKIRKRIAQYEI